MKNIEKYPGVYNAILQKQILILKSLVPVVDKLDFNFNIELHH